MTSPDTPPDQAMPQERPADARLQDLADLSLDWFWEQDAQYRFTSVTMGIADQGKLRLPAVLGRTRWEIPVLGVNESQWAAHRAALERREIFRDLTYGWTDADDEVRWLSVDGKPVFDEAGNFRGYRGIGRDVTARFRAEQALRDSERRLRALLELSSDWYWVQDEHYRLTVREGAILDRNGTPGGADLGKTHWEIGYLNMGEADWDAHRALLARREEFRNLLLLRRNSAGRLLWTRLSGRPLHDGAGRFIGYHGVGHDATGEIEAEHARRESEERFRDWAELASDWFWEQDAGFRFTAISSDRTRRGMAMSPDMVLGRTRWELPVERVTPAQWSAHRDALARHEPFRGFLYRARNPDGSARWISCDGKPVFAADGTFTGYRGTARDVTARIEQEELLRDSEAQLRLVTDNVPAAIAYLDRDLVLRFTSLGYSRILAHRPQLVTGARLAEALGPEVFETIRPYYERVMQGEALTYRRGEGLPDGTRRVVTVSLVPHRGADGSVLGCFAVTIDSGALDNAEARIRILESRFASALENTTDLMAMYRIDAQRILIEQFNPALRRFYESRFPMVRIDDWIGCDIDDFLRVVAGLDAPSREARLAPFRKALRDTVPMRYRTAVESPDGLQQRDSLLVPLVGADGAVTHLFYRGADITDLVEKERELNRLNADLERKVAERTAELSVAVHELESFAYSVSHDLRTPLRGIDGFAQLLEETLGDTLTATSAGYLQRIRRGITRMGALIDDMLRLARVTRGPLMRETVDLSSMAGEIAADLQRQAISRKVAWRLQAGVTVTADAGLMRLMLENLLGNAWKYSRDAAGPVIEFSAVARAGGVELQIRDNGAGFDMAYADKLFKAFQRLHGEKEFEGTGIGLATVARVVERHGGTVRAHGETGKGASIYVHLPDKGAQ
jgi:PAS domain S-box-containing protein